MQRADKNIFSLLPVELGIHVLSHLNEHALCALMATSRTTAMLASDNHLWFDLLVKRKQTSPPLTYDQTKNYKDLLKQHKERECYFALSDKLNIELQSNRRGSFFSTRVNPKRRSFAKLFERLINSDMDITNNALLGAMVFELKFIIKEAPFDVPGRSPFYKIITETLEAMVTCPLTDGKYLELLTEFYHHAQTIPDAMVDALLAWDDKAELLASIQAEIDKLSLGEVDQQLQTLNIAKLS
jgi:F-box domain